MILTDHEDTGLLTIAGSLDISDAEALRDALRAHVRCYPAPLLDLAGVEGCDAAVLQLLWSAQQTAAHANKQLRIAAWSEAIRQTGAALGITFEELEGNHVSGL